MCRGLIYEMLKYCIFPFFPPTLTMRRGTLSYLCLTYGVNKFSEYSQRRERGKLSGERGS
jgi:hypothetical protein